MQDQQMQRIYRIYELEEERLVLEEKKRAFSNILHDARVQQLLCKEKLMNFEGFSLSGILAKVKGTHQEQLEQYRRKLHEADILVDNTKRQLEGFTYQLKLNAQERETLPAPEAVREWIGEDRAGLEAFYRLEAKLCIKVLPPLLEQSLEALAENGRISRGEYSGQIMSQQEEQQRLGEADRLGEACKTWLLRLEEAAKGLKIPLEIGPYYHSPAAFIAGATQFTRLDRINQAMKETRTLQKQMEQIRKQIDQ